MLGHGSQRSPRPSPSSSRCSGLGTVGQLSPAVTPWRGGFPEVVARPRDADLWFASYLRTYLERDVRAVTNVRDLAVFRRFMALVAARTGQMVQRTELAGPLGVSVPTVSSTRTSASGW